MSGLIRAYGRGLTALFFALAGFWALALILAPQATMLERALTAPKRQMDSAMVETLARDAALCAQVLEGYLPAAPAPPASETSGGLAVPSIGGGTGGGLAVPSISGGGAADRPYLLQCDRATTRKQMVRPRGTPPVWLDELRDLPRLVVDDSAPIARQIEQARDIAALARPLAAQMKTEEASRSTVTTANFQTLFQPVLIPMSDARRAEDNARLSSRMAALVGLRIQTDDQVHLRIGALVLLRTILYAIAATALALLICYPIAYKVALASSPAQAMMLFVALVIPYAIVELMRIYAWTSIIDNRGVLNTLLDWAGVLDRDVNPIQFKRSALTVFVVVVYTYVLFMVFPVVNVMTTLDKNQIEAARDLGASTARIHRRIVIPHAKPGIAVGCIATFMLAAGAFSVPRIISAGLQSQWFAETIYNKFFESENSNIGAAYSFAYTAICFLIVALFMWIMRTRLKDFARAQ